MQILDLLGGGETDVLPHEETDIASSSRVCVLDKYRLAGQALRLVVADGPWRDSFFLRSACPVFKKPPSFYFVLNFLSLPHSFAIVSCFVIIISAFEGVA